MKSNLWTNLISSFLIKVLEPNLFFNPQILTTILKKCLRKFISRCLSKKKKGEIPQSVFRLTESGQFSQKVFGEIFKGKKKSIPQCANIGTCKKNQWNSLQLILFFTITVPKANSKGHIPKHFLIPELKNNLVKNLNCSSYRVINMWKAYGKIIQVGAVLNAQSFLVCQMQ